MGGVSGGQKTKLKATQAHPDSGCIVLALLEVRHQMILRNTRLSKIQVSNRTDSHALQTLYESAD